jgi:CRP-like cAMP-binding protein
MTRFPYMTGNLLLDALAAEDRERLLAQMSTVAFKQGDVLAEAGDRLSFVQFPVSGVLSHVTLFDDGSSTEAATVGREGVVGAFAAAGSGVARSHVVATCPGEALVIDRKAFCAIHDASHTLGRALLRYSEVLLAEARQEVACRTRHPVEGRLARMLLTLSDKAEARTLPLSQEFLATLMGAQRTSVNASAKTLKEAGGIRYSRGNITITDRDRLKNKTCECYAASQWARAAMAPAGDETGEAWGSPALASVLSPTG